MEESKISEIEQGKINVVKYWMERERLLKKYVDNDRKSELLYKEYKDYCNKGQEELLNNKNINPTKGLSLREIKSKIEQEWIDNYLKGLGINNHGKE